MRPTHIGMRSRAAAAALTALALGLVPAAGATSARADEGATITEQDLPPPGTHAAPADDWPDAHDGTPVVNVIDLAQNSSIFTGRIDSESELRSIAWADDQFVTYGVTHTFRPGHRILVQVHSTWFPLIERNPQAFVDIGRAKASDYHKATQRLHRSKELPSRLVAQMMSQVIP